MFSDFDAQYTASQVQTHFGKGQGFGKNWLFFLLYTRKSRRQNPQKFPENYFRMDTLIQTLRRKKSERRPDPFGESEHGLTDQEVRKLSFCWLQFYTYNMGSLVKAQTKQLEPTWSQILVVNIVGAPTHDSQWRVLF